MYTRDHCMMPALYHSLQEILAAVIGSTIIHMKRIHSTSNKSAFVTFPKKFPFANLHVSKMYFS